MTAPFQKRLLQVPTDTMVLSWRSNTAGGDTAVGARNDVLVKLPPAVI